jgi:hypothetical protein
VTSIYVVTFLIRVGYAPSHTREELRTYIKATTNEEDAIAMATQEVQDTEKCAPGQAWTILMTKCRCVMPVGPEYATIKTWPGTIPHTPTVGAPFLVKSISTLAKLYGDKAMPASSGEEVDNPMWLLYAGLALAEKAWQSLDDMPPITRRPSPPVESPQTEQPPPLTPGWSGD